MCIILEMNLSDWAKKEIQFCSLWGWGQTSQKYFMIMVVLNYRLFLMVVYLRISFK